MRQLRFLWTPVAAAALALTSCVPGGGNGDPGPGPATPEGMIVALLAGNVAVTLDPGSPRTVSDEHAISGLPGGETLVAIDFQASTGALYALGLTSRLYQVDPQTGVATQIGFGPFTPALAGTQFDLEIDPVADVARITSDAEQNLSVDLATGVATADIDLDYDGADPNFGANPQIAAAAFAGNSFGAASATLFAIDTGLDALVRIGGPGGTPPVGLGQVFTVGPLGGNVGSSAGFDITPQGAAFAAITLNSFESELVRINLATGEATSFGTIGVADVVLDLAVRFSAPRVFAVTSANNLIAFVAGDPSVLTVNVPITGVQGGENVLGIDFRPATGGLVALGSSSTLYDLDPTTGVATAIGTGFTPALNGTAFGFDFDPVADRLRVVSDAEQNLALDPATGAAASTDTSLVYAAADPNFGVDPSVVALAHDKNGFAAGSTTAFAIDSGVDALVRIGSAGGSPLSPASGELATIGALGVDTTADAALDVAGFGGMVAALTAAAALDSDLYRVDPTTGAATLIGTIVAGATVRAIAIEPASTPLVYGLTDNGRLVTFLPGRPDVILSSRTLILSGADVPVGLDVRPTTGELFVLGSSENLYRVDPLTGEATRIGNGFSPDLASFEFGVDFDPQADALRVVGNADENLLVDPTTGLALVHTNLDYAPLDPLFGVDPSVTAIAYTPNVAGTTPTTLFGIDSDFDVLVRIGSPGGNPNPADSGLLTTVGPLGLDTNVVAGFDISDLGGAIAAVHAPGATSSDLVRIDLFTGTATLIGPIASRPLRDVAFALSGP
jgi:hypothetical protein